jgi:23S rRNA (adenine2503-C2)-methyltransferase
MLLIKDYEDVIMIKSSYMQDLKEMNVYELKSICNELGLALFKAKEIFSYIQHRLVNNIAEMTTLKQSERKILLDSYYISGINPVKTERSKNVNKTVFQLEDGNIIESVLMQYGNNQNTVCLSSQVGCPIGCDFCATGKMGFRRNLSAAEILSQVYYYAKKNKITNIVFMGMGEPFLNYSAVMKAAQILNHKEGLNIAARHITFSTIGIIPGILKLAEEGKQFRLAWSLAAPSDYLRSNLIPFNGLPTIQTTLNAFKE